MKTLDVDGDVGKNTSLDFGSGDALGEFPVLFLVLKLAEVFNCLSPHLSLLLTWVWLYEIKDDPMKGFKSGPSKNGNSEAEQGKVLGMCENTPMVGIL